LKILGLKISSLRRKILTNRTVSEDLRGRHEYRPNKTDYLCCEDINDFIVSLPTERTQYGKNKDKKYLSKEFGSIANIHRPFIDLYPEHKNDISYKVFTKVFKTYDISINKPEVDICEIYGSFDIQIMDSKKNKDFEKMNQLKS